MVVEYFLDWRLQGFGAVSEFIYLVPVFEKATGPTRLRSKDPIRDSRAAKSGPLFEICIYAHEIIFLSILNKVLVY